MTDAELLYDACLRVERRMEAGALKLGSDGKYAAASHVEALGSLIRALREEIGRGIDETYPR